MNRHVEKLLGFLAMVVMGVVLGLALIGGLDRHDRWCQQHESTQQACPIGSYPPAGH